MPKKSPTLKATSSPPITDQSCTALGRGDTQETSFATRTPKKTPSAPPMTATVDDSIKNCSKMSLRRAPSALRTPISRVRSVTETSMIFMITMPPTTSEMEAMAIVTAKNELLMSFHRDKKESVVSMAKSSLAA